MSAEHFAWSDQPYVTCGASSSLITEKSPDPGGSPGLSRSPSSRHSLFFVLSNFVQRFDTMIPFYFFALIFDSTFTPSLPCAFSLIFLHPRDPSFTLRDPRLGNSVRVFEKVHMFHELVIFSVRFFFLLVRLSATNFPKIFPKKSGKHAARGDFGTSRPALRVESTSHTVEAISVSWHPSL